MFAAISTFRFRLVLRILLLFTLTMLFNYLLLKSDWQVAPILTLLCIFFTVIELVGFQEKQLSKIEKYLVALLHKDVSASASSLPKGAIFNKISSTLTNLLVEIGELRKATRNAELFSEQIIEHAPNAILCYDDQGGIILSNKAFTKLFGLPTLSEVKQLEKFISNVLEAILKAEKAGQVHFTFKRKEKECTLNIHHSTFKNKEHTIHILNMQDVSSQVVGIEVSSWEKLIRVLAHEIINSVTPIASLANTLSTKTLQKIEGKQSKVYLQLNKGLETIDQRSKGLIKFVEHYRMFVVNPKLQYMRFKVAVVLKRTIELLEETAKDQGAHFNIKVDDELELQADMELLEQVMINLVLNALEACKEKTASKITLIAQKTKDQTCTIRVVDEGEGMEAATKAKIFTPFFTTKEKGSGIGLSLSRQVVHLHGGTIDVYSELSKGTAITIELPLSQLTN